jgi:hypothetical protein
MTPADEIRAEAKAKHGQPVFWRAGAWEFGLSYGTPAEPPPREQFERHIQSLGDRMHTEVPATYEEFVTGWHLEVERGKAAGIENRRWLFSAMLYPRGRSSTEKDWAFLGAATAALRIPDPVSCCLTPPETTHPNAVHYWQWEDP